MEDSRKTEKLGEYVSVTYHNGFALVTFDRADGINALSVQAMRELKAAADSLASDTSCHAVVLAGRGAFSAGADLADPMIHARESLELLEQREAVRLGPDLCQAWADLEQITICAIERFCIGGGLALAVACDHRVAAENAHFRLPEVQLGMSMSWRSIPRITALLGPSRAKELVILGAKVSASSAYEWGLVDRLTTPGHAEGEAVSLAFEYSKLPPVAARMAKQSIDVSAIPLGYATSFMDRDQFLLSRQASVEGNAWHEAVSRASTRSSSDD